MLSDEPSMTVFRWLLSVLQELFEGKGFLLLEPKFKATTPRSLTRISSQRHTSVLGPLSQGAGWTKTDKDVRSERFVVKTLWNEEKR